MLRAWVSKSPTLPISHDVDEEPVEAAPGLPGSLSVNRAGTPLHVRMKKQTQKPHDCFCYFLAKTQAVEVYGGGHFASGLLLASISSRGPAEFVSQERYVLSSTAARLGWGGGCRAPEPAHRGLTYAGHRQATPQKAVLGHRLFKR